MLAKCGETLRPKRIAHYLYFSRRKRDRKKKKLFRLISRCKTVVVESQQHPLRPTGHCLLLPPSRQETMVVWAKWRADSDWQ